MLEFEDVGKSERNGVVNSFKKSCDEEAADDVGIDEVKLFEVRYEYLFDIDEC